MLKHMMKMLQMFALKGEKTISGLHFLCVTVLVGEGDRLKEKGKKKIRAEQKGKDDKKIRDAGEGMTPLIKVVRLLKDIEKSE